MKKISIITPCFNEKDCIIHCYDSIKDLFSKKLSKYSYEHIFADNNSTDGTIDILKKISSNDKNVKVILNSRNFGVFKSTFNAIRRSSGDAVVPMYDADLQDPPELIIEFVKNWENGILINAGRRKNRNENFLMKNFRKLYYRFLNFFSNINLLSDVGEYQLIDRIIVDNLLKFDDQNPYIRGIIASCGYETKIIDYVQLKRLKGKSKFSIFSYFNIFLNGLISFSNFPIRFLIYFGFLVSFSSIIYSSYLFLLAFFFNYRANNEGIMTILIAIFFLLGLIIFFLGIIGEYIHSIHNQVRKGPLVIEKEIINF